MRIVLLVLFIWLGGCGSFRPTFSSPDADEVIGQADIGVFLSLTDFHFDPFYDPKLFPELVQSPASEWPRIFAGSQISGYAQYGKDSNYNLFMSALKHAASLTPKAAFVLLAGDWLAHGLNDNYYQYAGNRDPQGLYQFIDKTIAFLTRSIREQFPDIPLYPVVGNEDSYCGDYRLQPKGEFLRRTAESWKAFFLDRHNQSAFMETFPTGGYYAVAAPNAPKHRIVVLNSVFFAADYRNQCGDPRDDPAGEQLRWLAALLRDAAEQGDQVWLLYHIPYGIDAYNTIMATARKPVENVISLWQTSHQETFLKLLHEYRNTIRFTLAGHSHMDEFRLAPETETGHPLSFLLVTPAISPIFQNNPGLQVLIYDRKTVEVLDYTTHRLDLTAGPSAKWEEEYRFSRAYKLFPVTPTNLETLARSLLLQAPIRAAYMRHYDVGNAANPQITDQTWPAYWCAIGHLTADTFRTCVENFSRP